MLPDDYNRYRVLIVDDEPDIRTMLQRRLESNGFSVLCAADGDQAMKAVASLPPDLILLDIMMPGFSGFELKRKLNRDPELLSIPVIFLTAKDESSDKVDGLELGVDDYITKPFDSEELIARIRAVLNRRSYYETISMTDSMTGLYNVHFLKKQFGLFFKLARRYGNSFSVLLIDVDDFKKINDEHGHLSGDYVLRDIATRLKSLLRTSDVVCRYGGDEFFIILPESEDFSGGKAAERIRNCFENASCYVADVDEEVKYSVSVGLVSYTSSFTSEAHMFVAVDEALYREKQKRKKENQEG